MGQHSDLEGGKGQQSSSSFCLPPSFRILTRCATLWFSLFTIFDVAVLSVVFVGAGLNLAILTWVFLGLYIARAASWLIMFIIMRRTDNFWPFGILSILSVVFFYCQPAFRHGWLVELGVWVDHSSIFLLALSFQLGPNYSWCFRETFEWSC